MAIQFDENINLKPYNSWQVGGDAEYFFQPESIEQLIDGIKQSKEKKLPITVIGDGTNSLISDRGVKGLVINLNKLSGIEDQKINNNKLKIIALAGTSKMELMRCFLKHKLSPALFLSGLPGNLGGGIVMNAGVSEDRKPKEFCEIVDWFEVVGLNDFKIKKYNNQEIEWVYRNTKGWQPGIITRAGLSWPNEADKTIPKKVIEANKLRISKQPLDLPSCGSTFKNPEGTSAGRLIEECGLKGFQIGGAQVSPKHANFLVNIDNAKATDIHKVIEHIKTTVKEKTGVELQTEVKYIGEW